MTISCSLLGRSTLLAASVTLSYQAQNILTLSMLVPMYYNTNSFFTRSFSLMHRVLVYSSSLIIKVLSELHFEVSWFHVAPWFYYFQIQSLQKNYLGTVPVFPDMPSYLVLGSFLINIFSTSLLLPALIVLRALANILE